MSNTQAALVGAPPPLPTVPFARVRDLMSASMAMTLRQEPGGALYTADQMRAYGEACARAALAQAEAVQIQSPPCDCETATSPDGARRTYCGSDQMRRAVEQGHAFTLQPAKAAP